MRCTAYAPAASAAASFFLLLSLPAGLPGGLSAQETDGCRILCTPDVAFEPTISVEKIAQRHRTAVLRDGVARDTARAQTEAVFEIVVAVGIPTEIPRVDLTVEAIWASFAGTDTNPFTGRTADEVGTDEIRDNPVELEGEINFSLITFEESGGWVDAHFDVVDQFSPAQTPGAGGVYTHKADLEFDVATAPFARFGAPGWLEGVELEGSLDYMVSGMPDAGDRFGEELFLDDASPWSLSLVLVVPLAS